MVLRYHQEKLDDEKKAEKEESFRLKRIAGQLAKQIKDFWSNIEKVAGNFKNILPYTQCMNDEHRQNVFPVMMLPDDRNASDLVIA